MSSSPLRPGADLKEQLEWYKTQYAQLETDLADFQESSKGLEEQLEKDVETAEKNERKWKQQVETLNFEVDEWKTKHKQAKGESNSAQNALQKEITTMRETIRTLQLQLRDTEVMNDDYERQARNTETSLEDMESKYNASIERGVLLEETIGQSEKEREELRIEAQRLRDELGDLKVENDIMTEKLRLAEETIDNLRAGKPSPLPVNHLRARSPASEASGITPLSPTASTPPPKSDTASDAPTPPSPPLSDDPQHGGKKEQKTPMPAARRRSLIPDSATPRPRGVPTKHARGPSLASTASTATSDAKAMRPPTTTRPRATRASNVAGNLPRSDSLYQIRGLIGRMQKIEERVQNARSKLPAPGGTPRGSPRTGSTLGGENVPSSVTMRRSSKRPTVSRASSMADDASFVEEHSSSAGAAARRESHVKRLSFGIPRPVSQATHRSDVPDRPPSAMDRPASVAAHRPSSRTSMSSRASMNRPPSRSGARTELGHYSGTLPSTPSSVHVGQIPGRPRSSMSGNYMSGTYASRGHRPSGSVTELRRRAAESDDPATDQGMPSDRRTTLERSAIPAPASALPKPSSSPQTKTLPGTTRHLPRPSDPRRGSQAGDMMPPPRRRQTNEVGETY